MKFFKISILFLFVFTYSFSYSQQFWSKQNSPTTTNLRRCFFLDSLNGWVVGDSGIVIHTTDKGNTWVMQDSHIKSFFTAVFFINERLGWALAWSLYTDTNFYGTIILKTTDGGTHWDSTRYSESNIYLKSIYFIDSLTGFFAGAPANFIKTTDAGNKWDYCILDSVNVSHFPVNGFCFYNRSIGFAYGGIMDMGGVVWKTTDGGNSWATKVVASEPLYKIVAFDSIRYLGIGGDFEWGPSTIRTYDAGANWDYRSLQILGVANSMSFRTKSEAWSSLGGMQQFIYTLDTGKSWTQISTPDSSVINDMLFTNENNGIAVGDNGVILKFTAQNVGIVKNHNSTVPLSTKLFQNYPNPFNPVTNIYYSVNHESNVTLKIYDVLGKEILTVNRGKQKEGFYSYIFHGENLPSGMYFYRLITESTDLSNNFFKIETRKMVLLK